MQFSLALFTISASLVGWPQFRGPDGAGISPGKGLPTTWSQAQNVDWKLALPGPGASSPIVFGEHVYVTCYSGYGVPASRPRTWPRCNAT